MKTFIWFVLGALFATGNSVITEVGQKITLKCGAGERGRVEWFHENKLIYRIDTTGRSFKGQSHVKEKSTPRDINLEISKVDERDVGMFVCKANGKPFEQTLTVVSVSVDPSGPLLVGTKATLHCQVTELGRTSTVEWQKPDGSLQRSNTVQLSPVDASHGGTWQLRVTYEADQFTKTLNIAVTDRKPTKPPPSQPHPEQPDSPNSKDGSNPTCNSTCDTKRAPGGKVMLLGLVWWVWVAVGVGSLVLFVLIVVIIVTVMRIRRKKRKLKMKAMLLKTKKYCQCEGQTAAPKPRQGHRREKPPALPLQSPLKGGHERGGRRANERENRGR